MDSVMDHLPAIFICIGFVMILGTVLNLRISAGRGHTCHHLRKFFSEMASDYLRREWLPADKSGPIAKILLWISTVGSVAVIIVLAWLNKAGYTLAQEIYEYCELIVGFYVFCLLTYFAFRKAQRDIGNGLESEEPLDKTLTWRRVITTFSRRNRTRWLEIVLGVVCAPASVMCAIWGAYYTYAYATRISSRHSFGALVVLGFIPVALAAFLARTSFRLIVDQPRSSESRLVPPALMITFGMLFCLAAPWLVFRNGFSEDSLFSMVFGLVAISIGMVWLRHNMVAKHDRHSPQPGED